MTIIPKLGGIVLPGSGYPRLIDFIGAEFPAGSANLIGLYRLGDTAEASTFNFADTSTPATVTGSPVAADVGLLLNTSNYLDTGFVSASAVTIIAVTKPLKPTAPASAGTIAGSWWNDGDPDGDSIGFYYTGATPTFRVNGSPTTGAKQATVDLSAADLTDWNSFAGRWKYTGEVKGWWGHDGLVTSSTEATAAARTVAARNILIGREGSGILGATVDVGLVAIFDAALDDADVAANLEYLRDDWGPKFGISTL